MSQDLAHPDTGVSPGRAWVPQLCAQGGSPPCPHEACRSSGFSCSSLWGGPWPLQPRENRAEHRPFLGGAGGISGREEYRSATRVRDSDFLTLVEGGKPHLTKLFRCVGENLITFGRLNGNQMWLEPIKPATFGEQHLPCSPQAAAAPSHNPGEGLEKTLLQEAGQVEAGCRTPGSLGQFPSPVSSLEPC